MIRIVFIFILIGALGIFFWFLMNPQSSGIINPGSDSSNIERNKSAKKNSVLTLEKIFDNKIDENSDKLITLIVTGDVIPARSVNFQATQRNSFTWAFEKTADVLKNADLTFIDLETPIFASCSLTNEGMKFCGSDKHIEGLLLSGVDVANMANNHAGNYGKNGIDETRQLLQNNGILVTGLEGPIYAEIKGVKFAFLGYNDIEKTYLVSSAEDEKIKKEVGEARENADVVIVQFHWGTEYITPPEERQKFLGKLTIDSGADLVIGNHPHWIKPIEIYNNKLITYAHGNFVFDQEWSQKTKEGVVGKYIFEGKNLVDVQFLPVEIKDYGQPYFLEGEKKQKILDEMYKESKALIN